MSTPSTAYSATVNAVLRPAEDSPEDSEPKQISFYAEQKKNADATGERYEDAMDKMRRRADLWGKTVLSIGTSVVTAFGIAKVVEVEISWYAAGVLISCVIAAWAVVFVGTRLTKVNEPVVMRANLACIQPPLAVSEIPEAQGVYDRFCRLNAVSSIDEYAAIATTIEVTLEKFELNPAWSPRSEELDAFADEVVARLPDDSTLMSRAIATAGVARLAEHLAKLAAREQRKAERQTQDADHAVVRATARLSRDPQNEELMHQLQVRIAAKQAAHDAFAAVNAAAQKASAFSDQAAAVARGTTAVERQVIDGAPAVARQVLETTRIRAVVDSVVREISSARATARTSTGGNDGTSAPLAPVARMRAEVIRAEIRATLRNAGATIVRRRLSNATTSAWSMSAVVLIPLSLMAAVAFANASKSSQILPDQKECVDILGTIADKKLPLTYDDKCGFTHLTPATKNADATSTPAPVDVMNAGIAAAAAGEYEKCVTSADAKAAVACLAALKVAISDLQPSP